MKLGRGSVVFVDPDSTLGHEQAGSRPAVVVSDPDVAAHQRYPLVCIVPITSTTWEGSLYPRLGAGPSGLRKESWALIDQIRSIGKHRIQRIYGSISTREFEMIDTGLALFLSLPAQGIGETADQSD